MGAHNSVVGADQGFRAPSWAQESVRDSGREDSASAPIAACQRPRPSFRHPHARNLFVAHPSGFSHTRALLRDRASQFTGDFDEIFRSEGLKILKTPVQAPVANAFAERWIATLRRELLDRTIIWNQRQLQRLVTDYIDHYNIHRPHRSLDQRPPRHTTPDNNTTEHPLPIRLVRTTRCDGLINEYKHAA